jgi:dUTP pyrophosphatase
MSSRLRVAVRRVGPVQVELPAYQTSGSAGLDLAAALEHELTIAPLERVLVPTGLALALPEGTEAQVRPRSGLAHKHGVTVLNAPGTIDSDFRGEIRVLLVNLGREAFVVRPGDRIAQLVVAKHERVELDVAVDLDPTGRGEGGYGSTGIGKARS